MKALLFKSKAALKVRYWARSLFDNVHSVCVKESKVILVKPEENEDEKTIHLTLPSAIQGG